MATQFVSSYLLLLSIIISASCFTMKDLGTKGNNEAFYTCLACDDPSKWDGFYACMGLLPKEEQEKLSKCIDDSFPNNKPGPERWAVICKTPEFITKVLKCWADTEIAEEYRKNYKDYIACMAEVEDKNCAGV
ncbi:uncharacterized protein LOC129219062 isoform X2 [Uloborus diversus]|uniref:uncharacterized protein LOC129219062 isoform X2 n=1 Tax=Uloborus diversus TaxID=327109 RepID=UPI002409F647|nr:uncharacterized protein LOC129219062 isoform X2 [Uloborus diversus]